MKKVKIILLFVSLHFTFFSQINLVPNPSFEDTISCPDFLEQIERASSWSSYGGSSDYFNQCAYSTQEWASTPQNAFGFQIPSSGYGYAGISTYYSPSLGLIYNSREFIGTQLFQPLIIGNKYFASMKVSTGYSIDAYCTCSSNNIGFKFSTKEYTILDPVPINNNSHIFNNTIISDTSNWVQVFGSFVADSAYSHISIGNFFDDQNTDTLILNTDTLCGVYYYIDDVCVSDDSSYALNYNYIGFHEGNSSPDVLIYPNPFSNFIVIDKLDLGKNYTIQISDLFGTKIFEKNTLKNKFCIIETPTLNSGMYILTITFKDRSNKYKLVKT